MSKTQVAGRAGKYVDDDAARRARPTPELLLVVHRLGTQDAGISPLEPGDP